MTAAAAPILVAGKAGQIARCLAERAVLRNIPVQAIGRPELDLRVPTSIDRIMAAVRPRAIVNAAAYTAVDRAESDQAAAFAVNEAGAERLAAGAAQAGIPFIHLSTDYVFDGRKRAPYNEDDVPCPLGAYGRSKLAGDVAVRKAYPAATILRIAWVYSPYGKNFLRTMLRLAAARQLAHVVSDQHGTPTAGSDIAAAILDLVGRPQAAGKLYNLANRGETTWYGFAEAIFAGWARRGRPVPELQPVTTAEYKSAAARPANSRLDCSRIERELGIRLPNWKTSLEVCLDRLMDVGAEGQS